MPRLEDVFGLYTKMLLGMGLVFQMPTVVFFLAKMKLVTARFLREAISSTPSCIIFVVAAVITPTGDPMTQTIFAAPMIGLYLAEHRHRLGRRTPADGCRARSDRLSLQLALTRLIDFEYSSAVLLWLSCCCTAGGTA